MTIAIPLLSLGIIAFVIASFAGGRAPDRRGATGFQLVMACAGVLALVAGLIVFATSSSRSDCRTYARSATAEDC